MIVATLVSPHGAAPLDGTAQQIAEDALRGAGVGVLGQDWLEVGRALDLFLDDSAADPAGVRQTLEAAFVLEALDIFVQPRAQRRKKLFIADMDSTMISVECIDELADFAGQKDKVAAVTEAAMRGELDFEQALDGRVALLAGLSEGALQRCYDERVLPNLSPGAATLLATLSRHAITSVLVSGGFTFFVERIADVLGFTHSRSNVLECAQGKLTGRVARPIVTAAVKRDTLADHANALGIPVEDAVAIGDGANDIPMIEAAGLGVAYRAKPKAAEAADAHIRHGDLTALLFALGIARADWAGPGS